MPSDPAKLFSKRKGESKKIQLELEVKDFGPIAHGKIAFKPLTLFVGPNNSGKSYAAMLLHSIFESYTTVPSLRIPYSMMRVMRHRHRLHDAMFSMNDDDVLEGSSILERQISQLQSEDELTVPMDFIEQVTNKIFKEIYEKRFRSEVTRSYACPLKDLARVGKRSFSIKINLGRHVAHIKYQRNELKIEKGPELESKIRLKITDAPGAEMRTTGSKTDVLVELDGPLKEKEFRKFIHQELMEVIGGVCFSWIFEGVPNFSHYLPAARSGILQGHKALAASIVKKAPYVGIESLEIPKFSGVVSDFISSIITLPEKSGPFYKIAKEFERQLIKGETVLRALDGQPYPEIKYRFQNSEIPLHRASSTVSELAPLLLYLKYLVEPGGVLIIEEPEAHLHPENQRILARLLVKLVRKGVSVTITTHSEYLLEQLSSFILLAKVDQKKRVQKYKYDEDDFLKPEEVGAYVFRYDARSRGHRIDEVEISEEDGISQEEFMRIHEVLYEQTIQLRRDISDS